MLARDPPGLRFSNGTKYGFSVSIGLWSMPLDTLPFDTATLLQRLHIHDQSATREFAFGAESTSISSDGLDTSCRWMASANSHTFAGVAWMAPIPPLRCRPAQRLPTDANIDDHRLADQLYRTG